MTFLDCDAEMLVGVSVGVSYEIDEDFKLPGRSVPEFGVKDRRIQYEFAVLDVWHDYFSFLSGQPHQQFPVVFSIHLWPFEHE